MEQFLLILPLGDMQIIRKRLIVAETMVIRNDKQIIEISASAEGFKRSRYFA